MNNTVVLGIDIGGSHITAALIDLETKVVIADSKKRRFVDSNGSADEILESWCTIIKEAYHGFDASEWRIGIAMPGPLDYEAGICLIQDQDKFRSLYKINLKHELAKRLNIDAEGIIFLNDAAAFLQGEVFCGAALNHERVLGLTLGTGLGAAIRIGEKALDAALWNSSFKDGIAEDYLSTGWFLKAYRDITGREIKGVKELSESGEDSSEVRELFERFAGNLAEFIALTTATLNFEHVVLGGNISNAYPFFLSALDEGLKARSLNVTVSIAELKEEAALIGAASCLKKLESIG